MSRRLLSTFAVTSLAFGVPIGAIADETITIKASDGASLTANVLSEFDNAWAMTMLPDGRMLVTEKGGNSLLRASVKNFLHRKICRQI